MGGIIKLETKQQSPEGPKKDENLSIEEDLPASYLGQ